MMIHAHGFVLLETQALHEEFCELFERICCGFLKEEGYTVDDFYAEVQKAHSQKDEDADEVISVIYMVRTQRWTCP